MIFYRAKTKDYYAAVRRYTRLLKVFPNNTHVLKQRADCQFEKNEWKKAADDYARIIKLQPENWEVIFKFGRACVFGNMPEMAVKVFTRIIRFDSEFESGYMYRAHAYRQMKRWNAAADDYTKAIELDNKYRTATDSLKYRGLLYLQTGEYEKATDDFSAAIGKIPYWVELYYLRGQAYMKMKLYEKVVENAGAIIAFDNALGTNRSIFMKHIPEPNGFWNILNQRAIAYMKLGQTEKAKTDFARAKRMKDKEQKEDEKERKQNEEIITRKDRDFKERNDRYAGIIRECNKAIKADKNNAKAYCKRAQCFYDMGYDMKALRDCSKAIVLEPKTAAAYETRVGIYYLLGDRENEIVDFEMFRELEPNNIWMLREPFDSYEETGRYEKALEIVIWRALNNNNMDLPQNIRQFQGRNITFIPKIQKLTAAIAEDPENAALYFLRGKTYDENYQLENAALDYAKAISLKPDLLTAYYYRAMANEDLQSRDKKNTARLQEETIADLSKLITLNDTIPAFQFKLGRILKTAGKYDSAAACFNKAIELHPLYQDAYLEQSAVFETMKDYQSAVDVITSCIDKIQHCENSDFFIRRGNLFYKMGEACKALDDYNKAMECGLKPTSALSDFMENRGKCYQELGEEEKAKADFEKAAELRKFGM